MRIGATLAIVLALLGAGGCAHGHGQLTNRQVAIGVGVLVVAGVIIYAATQSHCADNDCDNLKW